MRGIMHLNDKYYAFDIAFSYASENNNVVQEFKKIMRQKSTLKIYDYLENKHLTVLENTPEVLKKIYSNEKTVIIMFLSKEYISSKVFTNFESQIACDRYLEKGKLIVIKLDHSETGWMPKSKDYIALYGEKQNDHNEILKAVNVILKAITIDNPDTSEKLYTNLQKFFICKTDEVEVMDNIKENISLYCNGNLFSIVHSDNHILLLKLESIMNPNPMPLIEIYAEEIGCRVKAYIYPYNLKCIDKLFTELEISELIFNVIKGELN